MFTEPPFQTEDAGGGHSGAPGSKPPEAGPITGRARHHWWRRERPPDRVRSLPPDAAPPATWVAAPVQVEQLSRLYLHAQRTMWGGGLDYAQRLIVDGLAAANGILAAAPASGTHQQVAVTILDNRTAEAAGYVHRRELENARRRYVRGLAIGFWASLGLLVALMSIAKPFVLWFIGLRSSTPINNLPPSEFYALRDVLVCLGGGAAGATVSVLLRLRREDLTYETVNNGAAVYRIMLGWFFAAAVLFLIKGGLVTIFETPDEYSVTSWFFWGAVGFLAGFNERWATGLISRDPQSATAPDGPVDMEPKLEPDPTPLPVAQGPRRATPAIAQVVAR